MNRLHSADVNKTETTLLLTVIVESSIKLTTIKEFQTYF